MMMMDVIFTVSIDPTISTASFANLKNISCPQKEEETLLSPCMSYFVKDK